MSDSPRVSVIISTYNRPDYLKETLRSIVSQSFRDLEVLVVSDGPSDRSRAVVEDFRDVRLRYLDVPHHGRPAPARNAGIANAAGELIAFCDDDDLWEPEKLARQVAALSRHRAALCFTGLYNIDADSRVTGSRKSPPRFYDRWPRLGYLSVPGYYIAPSSVIVPKSVLTAVGGFDERALLRGREDVELFVRIAFRTKQRFLRVPRPVVGYRIDSVNPGIGLQVGHGNVSAFLEAVEQNAGMSRRVFRRFAAVQWILHARAVNRMTRDRAEVRALLDLADAQSRTLEARIIRMTL